MVISYPGAWRETQLVKHLVGRQEELTLNPGTHKKNSGLMVEAVSVLPGRQTTEAHWPTSVTSLANFRPVRDPAWKKETSQVGHT